MAQRCGYGPKRRRRPSPLISYRLAARRAAESRDRDSTVPAEPTDHLGVSCKLAEGEGFEPPRASRPGGFQVHCLAS